MSTHDTAALRLMHLVLDGEASPAERAQLDRLLESSAEARAQYEDLKALFAAIDELPRIEPPPGLGGTAIDRAQHFWQPRVSSLE